MPAAPTFSNRFLEVALDVRKVTWTVREKASGVLWRMAPASAQDVVVEDALKQRSNRALSESTDREVGPSRNGQPGAYLFLRDLGLGVHAFLDGRSLVVEVDRLAGAGPARVRDLLFPRHFLLPRKADAYATWTVGQGAIVPGNSTRRFHHPEGYSEQDMCFHGAWADGCGMVAIAETGFDLYVAMNHLPGEAPGTFFHWLPSLGDLRYTRRVRFSFGKDLDYVGQAKAYRRYMQAQGFFVSLAEKAKRNPKVGWLKGAAWVDTTTTLRRERDFSYRTNTFAEQAQWVADLRKRSGLQRAVVHVDGWGNFGYDGLHPEVLPPSKEAGGAAGLRAYRESVRQLGWLFGLHDQYIDIYATAPSYDESRLMIRENGRPNLLNVWHGGKCSHLCASESLKFVRRNYVEGVRDQYMYHNSPPIFEVCDPDASYLDCFCRIHECFHPQHPLTRAETAAYQRECLRTVREHGQGVVQSCEHVKWYAVPDVDFSYGLSQLKADVHVVGGGSATEPVGIPVPLWNLVFHDAVWTPEYTTNYGQMLLYGASAFLRAGREPVAQEELDWKLRGARLNAVVGFDEMTGFSMPGAEVFRSEFASGVRVTWNRGEGTVRVDGPRAVSTRGELRLPGRA